MGAQSAAKAHRSWAEAPLSGWLLAQEMRSKALAPPPHSSPCKTSGVRNRSLNLRSLGPRGNGRVVRAHGRGGLPPISALVPAQRPSPPEGIRGQTAAGCLWADYEKGAKTRVPLWRPWLRESSDHLAHTWAVPTPKWAGALARGPQRVPPVLWPDLLWDRLTSLEPQL